MNPANAQALTVILREGNPWLVGHNFGRVAPVFFLNALLQDYALAGAGTRVGRVLHLLNETNPSDIDGLPVHIEQADGLSIALRGALASDRRAFKTPTGSALLPVHRGLIVSTGSDDGLGKRVRDLLRSSTAGETFIQRVTQLFAEGRSQPTQIEDPVSRFGRLLSGSSPASSDTAEAQASEHIDWSDYDDRLATFVVNAFRINPSTQRIRALRSLALAGYMIAVLRMLQGPLVASTGEPKLLVAYAGLPPGGSQEPCNIVAIASFRSLVRVSWTSMIAAADSAIRSDGVAVGSSQDVDRYLRQRLMILLKSELASRLGLANLLPPGRTGSPTTLQEFITNALNAGSEVLSQRVRGLATKIGFGAPDRGTGGTRLALDTPLLSVLVDGTIPTGTMKFEHFVTRVRSELGIVLGIGDDDSFVPRLEADLYGGQGRSIYDVLMDNERELRLRLVRSGLARTYSDAHTEVVSSDA